MWTLQTLQNYIDDKVEENLHLDYKAAEALAKSEGKKKEISKDVSAFANSDGGIIIYGIKEHQQGTKFLPEKIDPINRTEFSKETLEQIINSNISPKIKGIVITPITIGDAANNDVVYVAEIPKSDTAHQANDKRYYKRYNFQSEAMEDWEIKDIINRKSKSEIIIWLEPELSKAIFEDVSKERNRKLVFDVWMQNTGNRVAEYIDLYLIGKKEDRKMFLEPDPNVYGKTFETRYSNEVEHKISTKKGEFVVNIQRSPLLPRISKALGKLIVLSDFIIENKQVEIVVSTEDNRKANNTRIADLIRE